jgi:Fur family transcriptional regulator, ferric uptake regulator
LKFLMQCMEYQGHFGADDLFVVMKNKKSRVSRATVYNTLELLVQCGLLTKRNFGDNMSHYEFTYRKQTHDHLICVDCGKIVEFASPKLKNIPQEISKELVLNSQAIPSISLQAVKILKNANISERRNNGSD